MRAGKSELLCLTFERLDGTWMDINQPATFRQLLSLAAKLTHKALVGQHHKAMQCIHTSYVCIASSQLTYLHTYLLTYLGTYLHSNSRVANCVVRREMFLLRED